MKRMLRALAALLALLLCLPAPSALAKRQGFDDAYELGKSWGCFLGKRDGLWRFYNDQGESLPLGEGVPEGFEDRRGLLWAENDCRGLFCMSEGKWRRYDVRDGIVRVVSPEYAFDDVLDLGDGRHFFAETAGIWQVFLAGEDAIRPVPGENRFDEVEIASYSLFFARTGEVWHAWRVEAEGLEQVPGDFEAIHFAYADDLFYGQREGLWRVYNLDGSEFLPYAWTEDEFEPEDGSWIPKLPLAYFSENAAVFRVGVGENARYGAVTLTGDIVLEPAYTFLDVEGTLALAALEDGGQGVMDLEGNWVLTFDGDINDVYFAANADETWCLLLPGEEEGRDYCLADGKLEPVAAVSTEIDLSAYCAWEGEKTPRLDGPASLKLSDPLPVIDGAKAVFPYYSGVVEAVYPEDIRFDSADAYVYNNTPGAYERIVSGEDDVIIVAQPSDQQRAAAEAAGVELEFTPIMREAFVFFVPADNPVDGLAVEQIRDIYSGRITDWADLGAPELGQIVAYQRNEGSGSQTALEKLMGDTPLMEPPAEEDFMEGIVTALEYRNTPNAIGFSFRWFVTDMMNSGVKLLALDGVAPTEENIQNGTYPVIADVYAVTRKEEENPNVRLLLDWMRSDEGQELVRRSGYVPVK